MWSLSGRNSTPGVPASVVAWLLREMTNSLFCLPFLGARGCRLLWPLSELENKNTKTNFTEFLKSDSETGNTLFWDARSAGTKFV